MLGTPNPKVRTERVSRQPSGESLFVYDANTSRYHELNLTAARVYELCDGSRSVAQIAQAMDAPSVEEREALALATLAQLDRAGLTEAPTPTARDFSRRRFAAAVIAPLVLSVTAHAAAGPGSVLDAGPGFDGGFDSGVGAIDGTPGAPINSGLDLTPTGQIDGGGPGPVNPGFDGMPPMTLDFGPGPQDGGGGLDTGVARPGRP